MTAFLSRRKLTAWCLALAAGAAAPLAHAQAPALDGALTLVVGYTAGGSTDRIARMVAERLGPKLGVAVTVENRRICGLDPEPEPGTGEELIIEATSLAEAVALVPPRWRKGGGR